MSKTAVLDASALLAAILGEPGGEAVKSANPCCASAVNVAEARTRLIDLGMSPAEIDASLDLLAAPVADFTADQAKSTAELRLQTRKAGLSLGDRACLALAMAIGGKALTADRVWATLELPVQVECVR